MTPTILPQQPMDNESDVQQSFTDLLAKAISSIGSVGINEANAQLSGSGYRYQVPGAAGAGYQGGISGSGFQITPGLIFVGLAAWFFLRRR